MKKNEIRLTNVRCCECGYHDDESQYHYCRKWKKNCPSDSEFSCGFGKSLYEMLNKRG